MDKSDVVAALAGLAHERRLDLPLPTLARLEEAGLVTFRSDGVSVVYAANHDVMNDVLSYLLANCQAATGLLGAAKMPSEPANYGL